MLNPKYLLAFGALPLLVATLMSFLASPAASVESPSDTTSEAAVDHTAWLTTAQDYRKSAEEDAVPLIQQLQKLDLLASELFPEKSAPSSLAGDRSLQWLKDAQESWEAAHVTHDGLIGVVAAFQSEGASDNRLKSLQDRLDKLKVYSSEDKKNPFKPLSGGPQLIRNIDVLCDRLKMQVSNEEYLIAGTKRLEQKDYAGCLAELDKIEKTGESDGTVQLAEADEVRRQAEFWKHWEAEPPQTDVTAKAMEERASLRRSSPPAELQPEVAKLEIVDSQLIRLNCEKAIASLQSEPPVRVRDYLNRVRPVLELCSDKQPAMRTMFNQWLKMQLEPHSVPANGIIEEAVTADDGVVVAGVFEGVNGVINKDKLVFYQYWKTLSSRQQKKDEQDTIYYPNQLQSAPRESVLVTCVKNFNSGCETLSSNLNSKNAWEDFQKLCGDLDKQLGEYKTNGGLKEFERASEQEASSEGFEKARKLADDVIADWEQISSLQGD